MKKTRILSFLLCLCMLFGTVTLLSSCGKGGKIKISKKTVDVDLTEYTLVYEKSTKEKEISTTFKSVDMPALSAQLQTATGVKFQAYSEDRTRSKAGDPEILVGQTGRAESVEALESIKGHGYTIQVINNKIVIVGTTTLLTVVAMRYFEENYLMGRDKASATLTLPESIKLQKMEMVTIADAQDCYVSFVHNKNLDTDPDNEYGIVSQPGTGRDYAYDLLQDIQSTVVSATGVDRKAVSNKQLTDQTEPTGAEIIVGVTAREETAACRAELAPDEYGIFVKNGKVVVTSWNAAGLMIAGERFKDYLKDSVFVGEDGVTQLLLPADLAIKGTANENWVTDFPKPDGLELYCTEDVEDDSIVYVYMGDGVNVGAYNAYCSKLKSEGYVEATAPTTIEDSVFALLVNKQKNNVLYVAYNAYKHAEGANFAYSRPTIRIVSSPINESTLPDESLYTQKLTYNRVTDSSLTAVGLPAGSIGTGYVMMLEDGRFVIMDGGSTSAGTEVDQVYNILVDLYLKAHKKEELGSNDKIKIAAWIISHNHGDHYSVLSAFAAKYGSTNRIELEYVIGNFPAESTVYNTGEASTFMTRNMESLSKAFAKPFTYLRVHTGQKLYFANLEIEVLFTPEDMFPHKIVTLNDSSTIMRLTLQPTEDRVAKGDPVSFVWTGDAYRYSGRWVCAMFGDYLESDMVAISHHGGPGVEELFYEYIQAEFVWFPNTFLSYKGYISGSSWYCKADRYACEMDSVKYIITADNQNVGGRRVAYNVTLFFTTEGPDTDNFYNAASDGEIVIGTTAIAKK